MSIPEDTSPTDAFDSDHPESDGEEIPATDLPPASAQPETQDEDPAIAALGDEGQGDLSPEDL